MIATVFSVSVVAGILIFSLFSDVFAVGKNDGESKIVSINEIDELATTLEANGIIKYPVLFSAYVKIYEATGGATDIKNTSAPVCNNMDYSQLLLAFTSDPPSQTVRITFPDHATTDQIIDIFVQNGVGTRQGFEDAINSYPFEYDFISELDKAMSTGRKYRLDGYLYPDTYDFYTGRAESYYIYKLLDRFVAVTKNIDKDISDQDIIIASMIATSTASVGQYEYISSVFHNRLNASDIYPFLNCPSSSAYATNRFGVFTGIADEEIKELDSLYNTFKNEGLPPGAICNPNKNAILAALFPATTDYKYFVTLENGEALFAKTEKEHTKNCDSLILE